jgi:microsomal prostaglandin-E synthase 2
MTAPITLYQFELCPFCHKVKAALDVKGLAYDKVEVNPYTKRELPPLPEGAPKKVPVLALDGEVVADSTDILEFLEQRFGDQTGLLPADEAGRARTREIEAWVDDKLTQILPAVIYGTWGEAVRAAQVTARTSNFGFVQNLMVRAGGSLIMHQVSKRIVARLGGGDPHDMLARELDQFEEWLGDKPFVCGEAVSLGDVATHGALTCIADFPAFERIMTRPRLAAWYERVSALRA